MNLSVQQRILDAVVTLREPMVDFASQLVRIPTVNPPGVDYRACAELIGGRLNDLGFEVDLLEASDMEEHTAEHPRVNVLGRRELGSREPGQRGPGQRGPGRLGPTVHLNGHFDVVPAGEGWSVDPFAGELRDGRLYGRGSADMKAGLAAAIYAAEALRLARPSLSGCIEISGTVDEESGGYAGVAWLARRGLISAARTDFVIIPEPLDPDRICIGHRGVWWFRLTVRGRAAHGSMPFLGVNAIDKAATLLQRLRLEMAERLQTRVTSMPVEPPEARRATLNVNSIHGGQTGSRQTPCVADRCEVVLDRRFLQEESFEEVRADVARLLREASAEDPDLEVDIEDLLVVHPVQTPQDSPLVAALDDSIRRVLGRPATLIASPGSYDHKHVAGIAGVEHCVAYGPGRLAQAHQPDEWCAVEDMVTAAQVMALTVAKLLG